MDDMKEANSTEVEEAQALRLSSIEAELSSIMKADVSNWTRVYILMDTVDKQKLYKSREDTPTFTSWVNKLADTLHVHVSLLWSRRKAGSVYAEYFERAQAQGRSAQPIESLKASPDAISLCAKVAGKNAAVMDDLIEKVVSGELHRKDLRAAAEAKRVQAAERGEIAMATSRHNAITPEDRTETERHVTAADVVLALQKSDWLPLKRPDARFPHIYQTFTEFAVNAGSTHYARRIDVLIAETRTAEHPREVLLRGIEIKVDPHDLLDDHKMSEYVSFCDYFYLAIPEETEEEGEGTSEIMIQDEQDKQDKPEESCESDNADSSEKSDSKPRTMLDRALDISRPSWGIVTVSLQGQIKVVREAELQPGIFRDQTLTGIVIKQAAGGSSM